MSLEVQADTGQPDFPEYSAALSSAEEEGLQRFVRSAD